MNPNGPVTPPWLNDLNRWFETAVKSVINTLGNAGQSIIQKAPPVISGPGRTGAENLSRSFWDLIGKGIQTPTPTVAPKVRPMLIPSSWRPPTPPPRAPVRAPSRAPATKSTLSAYSGAKRKPMTTPVRPPYRPGGY